MKNTQLAFTLLSVLVLTGCTTNEAAIVETTANSFNETPLVIEQRLEESQISQEISSSEPEQSAEIESSEEVVSSEVKVEEEEAQSDSSTEENTSEEVVAELVEDEAEEANVVPEVIPISEGVYTNYELESELIEDERIAGAMSTVVTYLKENNHYFDSAEYYFTVVQLPDEDLIELTIAEQYSDGEIIRGVFDYDLSTRKIDSVHK